MTLLFDSIRQGYPIGSILLWETSEDVASLSQIASRNVPTKPSIAAKYVLDGHQRLSTLFGVLRLPFEGADESSWIWRIWYDLRAKQFLHTRKPTLNEPHLLPVNSLLRTMDFLKVCRAIHALVPSESEALISEAESVAQRFKNYKLPVSVVKGDLDQAVETFARMNTTGKKITVDQMVSALTYREGNFHLDSRVDDILEGLIELRFDGVKRKTIFRTIVAAMGLDVYKTKWRRVSVEGQPDISEIVDNCEASIANAAGLLIEFGIPSDRFLPYEPILMLLAEFYRLRPNPSDIEKECLEKWFWRACYTGWFTGASDTNINQGLLSFRNFANVGGNELEFPRLDSNAVPFPSKFNVRSARARMVMLFLLTLNPRDLQTGEHVSTELAITNVYRGGGASLGNKILMPLESRGRIDEQLRAVPDEVRQSVLESHGISGDAWLALRDGRVSDFLEIRKKHLESLEANFIQSKGIAPASSVHESEFEIDDAFG